MGVRTVRTFYLGVATALLIAALTPGIAAAVVPPRHAVGNQYVETVPGAGGEEATAPPAHHQSSGGGSNGNSGGSSGSGAASPTEALGAKTAKRFEKAGDAGKAAANLAAATDPTMATAKGGGGASSDGGESPLKQVVGHLTGTSDDSGMGLLLPTLILASAVVAVGFLFAKRRPSQPRS
jgi:hypothetical protein